ncbi:hypothetical protein SY88_03525 [Clostridiales bacterium PH28_bin88]|nr:hypothetical protein SY88_03525 [Clostridiales bacterium PH28_bin88]
MPGIWEPYRQKLLQARREIRDLVESINAGGLGVPLQESVSELSSYDQHPGDVGSEVYERSKDFALRDHANIRLRKIDEALRRIQEGSYGQCQRCGRPIPRDRLEAEPETSLCIDCRRAVEGRGDRHPRPLEEDVVVPPFGGLTHDSAPEEQPDAEDEIMFDGEDAWQDLARWQEHAERAGAGSYFGGSDLDEDRGIVEEVEGIAYYKGADGVFYEDVRGLDDEDVPRERTIGDENWDVAGREP